MSDVFHEVDEELRRQQLDKVFKTYGPWVGAALFLFVAGYAGFTFWQTYQANRAAAASDEMYSGIFALVTGDNETASTTFAALAEDGPAGYAMLAEFQEAALLRNGGDSAAAVAAYDAIAADGSNEDVYRDLARYYAGLTAVTNPDMTYEDVTSRLEPVASSASPWRYHAQEVLGYAALREGDRTRAEELYRGLTEDALAPAGVAARANEMLDQAITEEQAAGGAPAEAAVDTEAEAETAPAADAETETEAATE